MGRWYICIGGILLSWQRKSKSVVPSPPSRKRAGNCRSTARTGGATFVYCIIPAAVVGREGEEASLLTTNTVNVYAKKEDMKNSTQKESLLYCIIGRRPDTAS